MVSLLDNLLYRLGRLWRASPSTNDPPESVGSYNPAAAVAYTVTRLQTFPAT